MKKRRTLVIALLLVAAIALGVGYAATTATAELDLNIQNVAGTVDLVWSASEATVTAKDPDYQTTFAGLVDKGAIGSDIIYLNAAGFKDAGDQVVFDLQLQNTGNSEIALDKLVFEGMTEDAVLNHNYFDIDIDSYADGTTLHQSEVVDVKITITLKTMMENVERVTFALKANGNAVNGSIGTP